MNKCITLLQLGFVVLFFGLFVKETPIKLQASSNDLITTSGQLEGLTSASGTITLSGRSGLIALAEFVNAGNGNATSSVSFVLHSNSGNVDGSGLLPIGYGMDSLTNFQGIFNGSGVVIENLSIAPYNNLEDGLGLFGRIVNATINNIIVSGVSINTVDIDYIGSIVGISSESEISGVQVLGKIMISGGNTLGGFVGWNEDSTISNSFVDTINMDINGIRSIGGFVGFNKGSSINNSYVNAISFKLSGEDRIGGFVGDNDVSTIDNSYVSASGLELSGEDRIGGFVGFNIRSSINNSYVSASGLVISGDYNLGGFVGRNRTDSNIANSFVNAINLVVSGNGSLGGFVGHNNASSIATSYIYSTSLEITAGVESDGAGGGQIGGFVGYNESSSISFTYVSSRGLEISGIDYIGGFIGLNDDDSTLSNSIATIEDLSMSGVNWLGGFVGYNRASRIENTFVAIDSYAGSSIERFGQGGIAPGYVFTNNYYNSGLTGDAWYEYNDDTSDTASEISTIDASELLLILNNSSSAFREVSPPSSDEFFPVLVKSGIISLANQPRTPIYWLIPEDSGTDNQTPPVPPSPSQPAPVFNDPSRGEPYIYDPVFLTIEAVNRVIEVGSVFELTYRGFSTFGPIIKDYTDDVVVTGSVNTTTLGTYPVTLSLTAEGLTITKQITVQVVDTTPPVISGPTNVRLFVGETYQSQLTVTDNVDASVVLTQVTSLDTSSVKVTEVVWQATDASGNVSTLTQTVEVIVPRIQVQTVSVNNQTFVFSVSEVDYNLSALRAEYVVSRTEPTSSSNWQVLTGSPNANPGERVFVRLSDGVNTSQVRQTIAVPETAPVGEPVVLPDAEPSSSNTVLIVLGSIAGLGAAASGWWFFLGKKRNQHSSSE